MPDSSLDKRIRVLFCHTCRSAQELPFYDGPEEYDHTLNYRVAEHHYPNGDPHIGIVGNFQKDHWDNPEVRREILARHPGKAGTAEGLGQNFYDLKSTFAEDAMACWAAHRRTTDCDEWRSERKRLVPDTRADRKEAGLDPAGRPNIWLCDWCPVTSIVQQKAFEKKGYYNKKEWE